MKEEYGQNITLSEAEEQETRLLKFFELLIKVDERNKITNK